MLAFDGFGASAFTDFFLLVANLGHEIGESAHVGFEAEGAGINFRGEDVVDGESRGIGTFGHEGGALKSCETTYYTSGGNGRRGGIWLVDSAAEFVWRLDQECAET